MERRRSDIDVDKMGAIAASMALKDNSVPDLIINASGVPKQSIPDTSVFFQKELGLNNIPCFSVHGTCLSFLIAVNNATSLINTGVYERILIISADRGTIGRNPKEPESAALLGDGAAAILMERGESKNYHYWKMNTWSEGANLTELEEAVRTFTLKIQKPKMRIIYFRWMVLRYIRSHENELIKWFK